MRYLRNRSFIYATFRDKVFYIIVIGIPMNVDFYSMIIKLHV